jgi:hypothetical protein
MPELGLHAQRDVREQQSLVVAASVRHGHRQPLDGEHPRKHPIGDRLGVDEHAVAVEDHQLRFVHAREPPT